MHKWRLILLPLVVMCGLSGGALLAQVEFLGFSGDGEYAALIQHWVCDGSGSPGAELMVMNVEDNSIVQQYRVMWPEERVYADGFEMVFQGSSNPAMDSVMSDASGLLDSLGISENNLGNHCVHHPLTDISVEPDVVVFLPWIIYPTYTGPSMSLQIRSIPSTGHDSPEWMDMWGTPVLLELHVTGDGGDTLLHHLDSELLPYHEYVWDYRIRDVYVYMEDRIAIVLNSMEPGFEGPDGMYRLVTGKVAH